MVRVNWYKYWSDVCLKFESYCRVSAMVFNAAFNNISVISWRSLLLVEETAVPGENHWPVASPDKLYDIMLYQVHLAGFEFITLVMLGTDCTGCCKSNYHTITTTIAFESYCEKKKNIQLNIRFFIMFYLHVFIFKLCN